jgi:putative transposase
MWKIFWRSGASPSATKPSDKWCRRFGIQYARMLRRRQWRLGDTWYLDELFVTIQGQRQYLWRAVDQDGDVIDILVQPRRDQRAAERFFRKLLKGQEREPRRLVTDKLRTYETARRILMPSVVHDTERYANNRAEVSHEPIRQRERQMRGFKSVASSATILVGARSHSESIPSRTPPARLRKHPYATIHTGNLPQESNCRSVGRHSKQ